MSKRFFIILIVFVLIVLLVSCEVSSFSNKDGLTSIIGDQPITEATKQSNGRIQQYYVDDQIEINGVDIISPYVSSEEASDYIVDLFQKSSESRLIPILGEYLEYTSLAACLFYKDESFIGLRTVILNEKNNQPYILSEVEWADDAGNPISDRSAYSSVINCIEFCPDFDIMGLVYVNRGYSNVYPIGVIEGDQKIRFFDVGMIKDFGYIDHFSSISEGQKAFEDYWRFRKQEVLSVPIFEWKSEYFYPGGYLSAYIHQEAYATGGKTKEEMQFLLDSDWNIVVPLLDDDGNEGSHVMHLLYDNEVLIAEIILCSSDDNPLVSVYQRVSEKDESTGRYLGLSGIKYCSDIDDDLSKIKNFSKIKGVYFDGTEYALICKSSNLGISDFLSSNLELVIFIICCSLVCVFSTAICCIVYKKRKTKSLSDENNE